jgi:hypothetical protein
MNMFVKILLVNSLTLLCASGVLAKTIKVRIQGEQAAKDVVKSIAARLQATKRYAVTDGDAELYLHLSCMEGKEVTSSVSGYICSFVFVYYPEKLAPMQSLIGPYGLVTGRDVSSVAEDVFTSFVAATADEKLERAQKDLRIGVVGYCHSSIFDKNVQADCAQNIGKTAARKTEEPGSR